MPDVSGSPTERSSPPVEKNATTSRLRTFTCAMPSDASKPRSDARTTRPARNAGLPRERDAWRIGLKALDAESEKIYAARFSQLPAERQDELLTRMANGELNDPAWEGMASNLFFHKRMAIDVIYAYYAHPIAWSEIGWGGPASPRGYVRMGYDERDPWEAAEVKNGDVAAAQRKNRHVR